MPGHEFFTALTVEEALQRVPARAAYRGRDRRPGRRAAPGPAEDVVAPAALPGFARSTVDGFAVRAADTYGVSDGLPGYLDVIGAVAMGRAPGRRRSGRAPPWRSRPGAPSHPAPTPS